MKRHKFFLPKKYLKSACASLNKIAVNYVKSNTLINYKSRQNCISKFSFRFNNLSLQKLKIFCVLTGKTRFIMRKFKISRICIKENLNYGYMVGFYKS
jgi:ribosomal protein S14